MGQLIVSAAGAAVGFALGGTTGAQIGWALFSALGPKPSQPGQAPQSLIDLKVTGTEYGQAIPWGCGTVPTAGQMWWNSDRQPVTTVVTTDSGGGKGGGSSTTSSTTTYKIDALFGLLDVEGVGIAWVKDNGKLVWSADADATAATLSASAVTGLWDRMTFYDGNASQTPDPTYETAFGAANAPAYRGRCSVFIQGWDLGQSGQIRNLTFGVVVDGSVASGINEVFAGTSANDQYIPNLDTAPVGNPLSAEIWVEHYSAGAPYLALLNLNTGAITVSVPASSIGSPANTIANGIDTDNSALFAYYATGRIYRVTSAGVVSYFDPPTAGAGSYGMIVDAAGNIWATNNGGSGAIYKLSSIDYSGHGCGQTTISGATFGRFLRGAASITGRIYGVQTAPTAGIGYVDTDTLSVTNVVAGTSISQVPPPVIGGDGNIYAINPSGTLKKYGQDGNLLGSLVIAGATSVFLYDSLGFVWTNGTAGFCKVNAAAMTLDSVIAADGYTSLMTEAITGMPVAYGATVSGVGNYGKIGLVEPIARVTAVPPAVSDVVSRLCLRAGLTAGQIDVTGLSTITRTVASLAISQIAPTRQTLELLMGAYFFEMVDSDKIYFRPRGSASVASIPFADLGATAGSEQPEPLELKEVNDLEIPAQIALSYINISDAYQTGTELSDRLISAATGTVEQVTMALGMTPAEAKAVADTMLLDRVSSRWGTTLALLGDYCALEPTDVVTVTGDDGSTFTLRLVKKTDSYPVLTFDAVIEDATVLVSPGVTSTDYAPQTTVLAPINTSIALLDIPILRDDDDAAGLYVAAKGDDTPYPGAAVYNSTDDVEYTRKATVLESAVFGTCQTTLGDWTGSRVFDEKNSVTVNVGDGTLASTTRDAVLNSLSVNAMLIGSELIQFRTATLVSAGIYTLSGLLRGGRGTEWAMTGHAASERCVLLRNAGLRRVTLENGELGLSRYYKGVTIGRAISTATAESFTCNAVGLKPFSPFDLRAARDSSNNITFTWQRRTRLSVRTTGTLGISIPLGEDSEAYEIDVYSDDTYATVVRTISATSATAGYTAAEQTADGLTPGDPVYAKVYQISVAVGRGYALQAAA